MSCHCARSPRACVKWDPPTRPRFSKICRKLSRPKFSITRCSSIGSRALATYDLADANDWRVIMRELLVGMLNGIAFAVITGVAAYFWFRMPGLGIVIGVAMICNLVAAALGCILISLALYRLRADPAVAPSPFMTTVTDVVGFFSFLSIATAWFVLR
jgi:magnesium transporter